MPRVAIPIPIHSRLGLLLGALSISASACLELPPADIDKLGGLVSGEGGSRGSSPGGQTSSESDIVPKGQICAKNITHAASEACVPSGGDVTVAMNMARANCAPIRDCTGDRYSLFIRSSDDWDFAQEIRSAKGIEQMFADADTIVRYASHEMSAEDYEWVLKDLAGLFEIVSVNQQRALTSPPALPGALKRFEERYRKLAGAETDPLRFDLAIKKMTVKTAAELVAWVHEQMTTVQTDYAALARRFEAYKATETTLIADLTAFSTRASAASLDTLPSLEDELFAYRQTADEVPDTFTLDAARLAARTEQVDAAMRPHLLLYETLLDSNLGGVPEPAAEAQRSIANMIAYCDQRRLQMDREVAKLLRGIRERREALMIIDQAPDATTRSAFRRAALVRAGGAFLREATKQTSEVSKAPPTTTKHRYPLWTQKYDRYQAFLKLEPLCGTAPNPAQSWRGTGCIAMQREFNTARAYTSTTIPRAIRAVIPQLRRNGVPEADLVAIEALLTEGRTREAAVRYDGAASMTEAM